ncbi:MAG TPA: NHL repeat-containing protein [bacterium]
MNHQDAKAPRKTKNNFDSVFSFAVLGVLSSFAQWAKEIRTMPLTFWMSWKSGMASWRWIAVFLLFAGFAFAAEVETLRDVPSTYMYPPRGFLPFNVHRGTATLLSLMVPGAFFNDPRGIACALLKTDHDPNAPQNDVVVTVIGVNSGAGELLYNVGLKDLRRFGSLGKGDKQFTAPTGAAIDADGDVAVADTGNNRVAFLKHDGLRLKWVRALGKKGTEVGQFSGPLGLAFDSKDNLYIADTGNNRIQVRDAQGNFHVLKTPPLERPSAIAVIDAGASWTFFHQGAYANRLAIIDQGGKRLQTLSLEGEPLVQFTVDSLPDPPAQFWGCAFDYYGNVVVTDFAKSCLRKFDKDLHYLVSFGTMGDDDFQFLEPRGIAIQNQFGQILVAEKKSVQYFWVGADAVSLKVQQEGPKIRIPYFLTEKAFVTAEIKTPKGVFLKTLATNQDLEEGSQELDWAPDPSTPKGEYLLVMRVMASYSTRERIAKEFSIRFQYE